MKKSIQIKNIFQISMMVLLFVAGLLMFTACGDPLDKGASINTDGDYEDSSSTDLISMMSAETTDTKEIGKGYQITIKTTSNADNRTSEMFMNALVKMNESGTGADVIVMKMTSNSSYKSENGAISSNSSANMTSYVDKDFMYFNGNTDNSSIKAKIKSNLLGEFTMAEQVDYDITLQSISAASLGATVKKSESGSTVKYEIVNETTLGEKTTTTTSYLVFESNKLVGFSMKVVTETSTIETICSTYSDKIEIPSDVTSYAEISLEEYQQFM